MFTIIVITLMIAAVPLGCYLMLRTPDERSPFRELAKQIGSTKRRFGRWTGVHQGVPYEYVLGTDFSQRLSSSNRLDTDEYLRLRVRIRSTPRLKFRVTLKTGADRFWRRFGIGSEGRTGDDEFDRKFLLDQKGPGLPVGFFADADRRKALAAILDRGFQSVVGNGLCLEARRNHFSLSRHPDPALITGTVANLAKVFDEVAKTQVQAPIPSQLIFRARKWALAAAESLVLLGVFGFTALSYIQFPPLEWLESILIALWPSLAVVALIGWGLIHLARTRTWSPRRLTANVLMTVVVVPALIWSTLIWLNGSLDQDSDESHTVKILEWAETSQLEHFLDRLLDRRDQRIHHYLYVQSWRKPEAVVRFSVNPRTYAMAAERGYVLEVTSSPGRFGLEWLKSFALVKASDAPRSTESVP